MRTKTTVKDSTAVPPASVCLSVLTVLVVLASAPAGAQTWTLTQAPPQTWSSIACSADGSKFVAVLNNGSIWTSPDSGATWLSNSAPALPWVSVASAADGSRLVAVAGGDRQGAIYVSDDAGTNWVKTSAPSIGVASYWRSVACSADRTRIIAASAGQIFLSKDGGGTWTAAVLQSPPNWSVASSADGTMLYACPGFTGTGGIRASTNSGATWYYTAAPSTNRWSSLACSADGSKVVALSGYAYISTNSGASWSEKKIATGLSREVAISADGKTMIAVGWENGSTREPGFVYASTDSGATWTDMNPPARSWNAIACSADGAKWVGAADVQTYVFERPPTPELAIRNADGAAVLLWLIPSKPLVLEESAGTSPPDWSQVLTNPATAGYENRVAVSTDGAARFYRLRAQ